MASGWFNSSTQGFIRWLGFNKKELQEGWREAVTEGTFLAPGGGAEKSVGKITTIKIKSRNGNPVHYSHYNPRDKNPIISVLVKGTRGMKTCHIYKDGKGTTRMGEQPT